MAYVPGYVGPKSSMPKAQLKSTDMLYKMTFRPIKPAGRTQRLMGVARPRL